MTSYIIEFAMVHSILILLYKIVMKKETQLSFLRGYLLVSFLFALTIPLLSFPTFGGVPEVDISGAVTTLLLPEVTISATGTATQSTNFSNWVIWIFVGGACFSLIRLLIGYLRIQSILNASRPIEIAGKNVLQKDQLKSSFTFFNRIIIDKEHFENPMEVIYHEEAHVKYRHSFDVFISSLFTIPFWWLPSIWISIKELKNIHEYQADAYALRATSPDEYIKALVTNVLVNHGLELTSSFHDTKIFERLNFIKKMKKSISPLKIYSTILIVALTAFVFSCEDKIDNEIQALVEESQAENYSESIQTKLQELRLEFPNTEFKVLELSGDKETLQKFDFSDSKYKEIEKIGDQTIRLSIIVTDDFEIKKRSKESEKLSGVYTEVEELPKFPGGKGEMMKYLVNQIEYPRRAADQGVAGKVFVEFVVDKSGAVVNAQVLKGIGSGCDEEALRVVSSLPDWTPGKLEGEPVNVKMVLPITFALAEK
jgi:TonB family protein